MEGHCAAAAAIAPDAQRDLLRHGAAGHEHRGLLAQQLGDPGLQPLDPLTGAVDVRPLLLAGRLCDLLQPSPHRPAVPAAEEALGAADRGLGAGVIGHGSGCITPASPTVVMPAATDLTRPTGRGDETKGSLRASVSVGRGYVIVEAAEVVARDDEGRQAPFRALHQKAIPDGQHQRRESASYQRAVVQPVGTWPRLPWLSSYACIPV